MFSEVAEIAQTVHAVYSFLIGNPLCEYKFQSNLMNQSIQFNQSVCKLLAKKTNFVSSESRWPLLSLFELIYKKYSYWPSWLLKMPSVLANQHSVILSFSDKLSMHATGFIWVLDILESNWSLVLLAFFIILLSPWKW